MHAVTHQARTSSKPHPLALQTQNLAPVLDYQEDLCHLGNTYSAGLHDSPNTLLSTPVTPARSFCANGSAAESMTSFSPSSNTSGEPDSPRSLSPDRRQASALEGDNLGIELLAETKRFDTRMASRQSRRLWTHSLEKYIFTPHEMYVSSFLTVSPFYISTDFTWFLSISTSIYFLTPSIYKKYS